MDQNKVNKVLGCILFLAGVLFLYKNFSDWNDFIKIALGTSLICTGWSAAKYTEAFRGVK